MHTQRQQKDSYKLAVVFTKNTGSADIQRNPAYASPMRYFKCDSLKRAKQMVLEDWVGKVQLAYIYHNGELEWSYRPEEAAKSYTQ